jgi:type IV secretory pathway VirD2 relaxase
MADLRAFARDLMKDAERDLGTSLDWVAVDHWNTDNPDVHMLVRGRADGGQDLVISRDYIGHGFRSRGGTCHSGIGAAERAGNPLRTSTANSAASKKLIASNSARRAPAHSEFVNLTVPIGGLPRFPATPRYH